MKWLLVGAGLLPCMVWAGTYELEAAAWQQPRSGALVKSLPPVRAAVNELLAQSGAILVIRHANNEEGALWGAELHHWLVSLGVPPAFMRLETAAEAPAALQLEVRSSAKAKP